MIIIKNIEENKLITTNQIFAVVKYKIHFLFLCKTLCLRKIIFFIALIAKRNMDIRYF